MTAMISPMALTSPVAPGPVLNQDGPPPRRMKDLGHIEDINIRGRSHDAQSHSNGLSEHPNLPEAAVRGSTCSDGDRDGSDESFELHDADLKALVSFEGDTGSCAPHKFKPFTSNDQLGKGSYGIVFVVECELCGNVSPNPLGSGPYG